MKLVLWQGDDGPRPGILTTRGVVLVPDVSSMVQLIDEFSQRRAELEQLAVQGEALKLDNGRLLAPLSGPGKILCSTASHGADPARLLMTLKSAESAIGRGRTPGRARITRRPTPPTPLVNRWSSRRPS